MKTSVVRIKSGFRVTLAYGTVYVQGNKKPPEMAVFR